MSRRRSVKASPRKPAPKPPPRHAPPLLFALGLIGIFGAAGFAFVLVLEHILGLSLPGCGEDSACQEAVNSTFGRLQIGGFAWPTSFLGFTYFVATAVAWIITRGGLPRSARWTVRLGMLASVALSALLAVQRTPCPYCLASHAGNFLFWLSMELARTRAPRAMPAWSTAFAAFVLSSVGLGAWDQAVRVRVNAAGERERTAAVEEMIERSRGNPGLPGTSTGARETPENEPERSPENSSGRTEPVVADDPQREPFEGRYRWGPESAPVRIVMITSYQCSDCYRLEHDLERLMTTYEGTGQIAVSVKHFPFTAECNPYISRTTQPNACWAARAAEAAGILWGSEGFWKMHKWLFSRRGVFQTEQELLNGIRGLGYEPANFVSVMSNDETLARVRADCHEAKRLGLFFTPMIFINGVELKGWHVPNALPRTVEQLLAQNLPARTAAADQPAVAVEKYLADWRDQPAVTMPADAPEHALGPAEADAAATIVVWGDYREQFTVEADQKVREFVSGRSDVRYVFRHYPFNNECNPNVPDRRHPAACIAARAAEAAATVGGEDSYWRMHAWLMENHTRSLDDATMQAAAVTLDLDPAALLAEMQSPAAAAAIRQDVDAGKQLPQLRIGMPKGIFGVPTVFVNNRYVPRWDLQTHDVLRMILEEAARR